MNPIMSWRYVSEIREDGYATFHLPSGNTTVYFDRFASAHAMSEQIRVSLDRRFTEGRQSMLDEILRLKA